MEKITGYQENIEVDGKTYTVTIIGKGTGTDTIYWSYISGESGIMKELSGFPVDQRQATIDPKVYTPEEVMELSIGEALDFINDIDILDNFDGMLTGLMMLFNQCK